MADEQRPPNRLLTKAREAMPSPSGAPRPMSRQELAEAVNTYLWQRYQLQEHLDRSDIGRLERGEVRWPADHRRAALRYVLGANTDAEIGLYLHRRILGSESEPGRSVADRPSGSVDDVKRRELVRDLTAVAGAGLMPTSVIALAGGDDQRPAETPVPSRVGHDDVAQLEAVTQTFTQLDHCYGGGLVREAMSAQLRWAAQLTGSRCPAAVQPALYEAIGSLAAAVAFSSFDIGDHDDARRTHRFALGCAVHSGNWHLRAAVLSDMARQAVWVGDADDALMYVEIALVRANRLTATERAMLHTVRARALAQLDSTGFRDVLNAVAAADKEFEDSNPAEDPSWTTFYDMAQHQGDTGHALFPVALAGHCASEAASRLSFAVAHHGAGYARSRAFSQMKLAVLTMKTGDQGEAFAIGQKAVESASALRSQRISTSMYELRNHTRHFARDRAAGDLCHRIDTALAAA